MYFKRRIGYYIIQFFVPTICLVFLSWVTLFMSVIDAGDRIAIGVTLILTMIFLLGYVNSNLPKVSYIKAIDWFAIVSLVMIILSVIESVSVYYLVKMKKRKNFKKVSKTVNKSLLDLHLKTVLRISYFQCG